MKNIVRTTLLLASLPLVLSSCTDVNKRLIVVETSNTTEYVEGKCYQTSYKYGVETIYLVTTPNNPESDPKEYTYDFIWKDELKNSYFDFVDGLAGKNLISVLKISNSILKLNVKGSCEDTFAKYGYIKIYRHAYTSQSDKIKNTPIYAYVAIGEQGSELVDKPALNDDGTIAK